MPEPEIRAGVENRNAPQKTEAREGMTVGEAQTEDSLLSASPTGSKVGSRLIAQYGCGPVQLTGTADALYERHLVFDNVMEGMEVGARERFEAVAHSVRDILSQRWIQTEKTYQRADPKRVYYLSMEFLIGRSLANNVTNLLLDDIAKKAIQEKN
jgi:starch phosphorylase